jgi:hypothetical protein
MTTVANVVAGKPSSTGGVFIAPIGTTAPTDATTVFAAAFTSAGYIGEDGVTESTETSVEKIKAWGGDPVKVMQTEHSVSFQFTFIETLNSDVLKAVYGDGNVTTTPATGAKGTLHKVNVKSGDLPHKFFAFQVKDGNATVRIVVPDGQITEVGEVTYSDSEVIGYQVTVEAFAGAGGVKVTKYLDDGVTT